MRRGSRDDGGLGSLHALPPEQRILDAALAIAADLPDDPYALHTVSAALMTIDGDIYTGVNLEHFAGGPCAEVIALGAAATAGARPVTEIVAAGNDGAESWPSVAAADRSCSTNILTVG